jgi:GAF domain-containing protein
MNFDSSHPRARPSGALERARGREPKLIDRLERSLSTPAGSPDRVVELMARCTVAAVDLVVGVDHAGVTASLDSEPFTVAPTDERVEDFDRKQYLLDDGPCLSASRTGRSVRMSVEQLGIQWPALGVAARNAGLTGFLAVPLFNSGLPVGSLNMYSHSAVADTDRDHDLVLVIAEYLGAGLDAIATDNRLERAGAALRRGIASRAEIERAVGILMVRRDTDPETAFSELEAEARRESRHIRDVARQTIISADDDRP